MEQLSQFERDQGFAATVLASITGKPASELPGEPAVVAFKHRPDPAAISRMASERMNQMDPVPPPEDHSVVRRVWMSWLSARYANTAYGRTRALNQAVEALASLTDDLLRQRIIIEQWSGSSPSLRHEYEAIVSAHPVIGGIQWETKAPIQFANAVTTVDDDGNAPGVTPTLCPESLSDATDQKRPPEPKWISARRICGAAFAASALVGIAIQWQKILPNSEKVVTVPVTQAVSEEITPKVADLPATEIMPSVVKVEIHKPTGTDVVETMSHIDLLWLRTDNVPMPSAIASGSIIKYISTAQQNHDQVKKPDPKAVKFCMSKLFNAEQTYGLKSPEAANCLSQLSQLHIELEQYAEAEPYLQRLLKLREEESGSDHRDIEECLDCLADAYFMQHKYDLAKPLYQRIVDLQKAAPDVFRHERTRSIEKLAKAHLWLGEYHNGRALFEQVLALQEAELGTTHPDIAATVENLGMCRLGEKDYESAGPLFNRGLSIRESTFGANDPLVAASLNSLAMLACARGDYARAEPLLQRAVSIAEHNSGSEGKFTADCVNNLAKLKFMQAFYAEAELLFRRVWQIRQKVLGPDDEDTKDADELVQRTRKMRGSR